MYVDVNFGVPAAIDEIHIETSPDFANIKIRTEVTDDAGSWVKLGDDYINSAIQVKANIRRAATWEMHLRGVNYLLMGDTDWGSDDIREDPEAWGLKLIVARYGARLYQVMPLEARKTRGFKVKLFLGVDGGQSSTTALIGDETGRVIGVGRAGPINHVAAAEGRAKFLEALGASVAEAAHLAGLSAPEFESACLGFSGGPADKEALTREAIKSRLYLHHARRSDCSFRRDSGAARRRRDRGHRIHRVRPQSGGPHRASGRMGLHFRRRRRRVRSGPPRSAAVLRNEEGWGPPTGLRESLLRPPAPPMQTICCIAFTRMEYPRQRVCGPGASDRAKPRQRATRWRTTFCMSSAHTLATLAAAVRRNLFLEHLPGAGQLCRRSVPMPSDSGTVPPAGGDGGGQPRRGSSLRTRCRSVD